jgi:hypothetical protein
MERRAEPTRLRSTEPMERRTEPPQPAPEERPRATIPPRVAIELSSEAEGQDESELVLPPTPPPAAVAVLSDRAAIEAGDPERKKARKLARLMVSEIKLYNEKLVAEGQAAGDLYARLKEPIDQSFVVFQKRIPESVRAEFDYMHDELVRQLAIGDASKLGPGYERPRRA